MKRQDDEVDLSRREKMHALLGLLGGAVGFGALAGCANPQGSVPEPVARAVDALSSGAVEWVATVLGAAPPNARTGDLATHGSAAIGAVVVVAEGCVTAGDGGGGIFYWDSSSGTGDDGGTVIVPSGAGEVGRWIRLFSGPPDIRWFGASSSAAGNTNAVAVANALAAYGAALVPPGTFSYSSTIVLAAGQRLSGMGPASTLNYTGAGAAVLIGNQSGSPIVVEDLHISSVATGGGGTSAALRVAVSVSNSWYVSLRRLTIQASFGFAGIYVCAADGGNSAFVTVQECNVQNLGGMGDGLRVDVVSGGVPNCGIRVLNNQFQGNGGYGISVTSTYLDANSASTLSNVHIENNDLEGNALGGLNADTLVASRIVGNYFENSNDATVVPMKLGAGQHGQCFGVSVVGNMFHCKKAAYCVDMSGLVASSGIVLEANSFNGTMSYPKAAIFGFTHHTVRVSNNYLYGAIHTLINGAYGTLGVGFTFQADAGVGFFSASPAGQQTGGGHSAGATYGTNEQAMLQTVYSALRTFGLLS